MPAILKKGLSDAQTRKIDQYLQITDLFSSKDAKLDIVISTLNGPHGYFINAVSDKVYLILEGSGEVNVDGEKTSVVPMDVVYIRAKSRHGIFGDLKFLVITTPPFNPADEIFENE